MKSQVNLKTYNSLVPVINSRNLPISIGNENSANTTERVQTKHSTYSMISYAIIQDTAVVKADRGGEDSNSEFKNMTNE